MAELTAEEITRRIQRIDPQVRINFDVDIGWQWIRFCPKHLRRPGVPDGIGQLLGHDYDEMTAKLMRIYDARGLSFAPQSPQVETEYWDSHTERWHKALDAINDLIALSIYRRYLRPPQSTDLLSLVAQARALIKRYEADEQQWQQSLTKEGSEPSLETEEHE